MQVVAQPGTNQQMVVLKTNDPQRPLVYLTVLGTVPQDLRVSPPTLLLDNNKGLTVKKQIQIIGPSTMSIEEVSTDNPAFKVANELIDTEFDKKIWQIHVLRSEEAPIGESKVILTIRTTHPERKIITIPITSIVRGDLQVTPPGAFFGFIPKNKLKRIELVIKSQNQMPFQIKEATSDSAKFGGLNIQGVTTQRSPQHKLIIELNAEQAQLIDGHIEIKTDVPGEETLRIPVTAILVLNLSSVAFMV